MELYNLKLTNGTDLLGVIENPNQFENQIHLRDPIEMFIDIRTGIVMCKKFNMFSYDNCITINRSDTIFISRASESAEEYYQAYLEKNADHDEEYSNTSLDSDEEPSLEDMMLAQYMSKNSKLN